MADEAVPVIKRPNERAYREGITEHCKRQRGGGPPNVVNIFGRRVSRSWPRARLARHGSARAPSRDVQAEKATSFRRGGARRGVEPRVRLRRAASAQALRDESATLLDQ